MMPPVVGPGDEVDQRLAVEPATVAAKNPHSSLVAAGSWRTWNFST